MRALERLVSPFGVRRPLSDEPVRVTYASEPMPLPEAVPVKPAGLRGVVHGANLDAELIVLGSVLAALSAWFIFSEGPQDAEFLRPERTGSIAPAIEPDFSFAFVSPAAKGWIEPAFAKRELDDVPSQGLLAAERLPPPAATPALAEHALPSDPAFDPLGAVVFSGLPSSTRLSAGAQIPSGRSADSDWAVPFGDLDNLVIELPRDRKEPVRTTLDLRTREGAKITSISIEIRESEPPKPVARPAASNRKARVLPAKSSQVPAKETKPVPAKVTKKPVRQQAKPAATPALIYPGDAPKVAAPVSKVPAPNAVAPAPPGLSSAMPMGFFNPDPKDSASGGLSPALRDDPRFTTLRGLGMQPTEPPPVPAPPEGLP